MSKLFWLLAILLLLANLSSIARVTPPPSDAVTLDAEWEQREGIIVSYPWYPWFPFGNLFVTLSGIIDAAQEYGVVYIKVQDQYQADNCINDLNAVGIPPDNIEFIYYPSASDDEWTRDYGPWFVWEDDSTLSIADQRYFDGQQVCDDFPDFLEELWSLTYYGADLKNEGGNMMTDGHGTMIMTDHVLDANPHISAADVNQIYHDYFGQDTVYIFEGLAGDEWNHIDGWAKFMNDTTIMVARFPVNDPNYQLLEDHALAMAQIPTVYGTPFNIIRCQLPDPWWYTYLNGLLFNGLALVPTYGFTDLDNQAIAAYQEALGSNWDVIGVDSHWIAWLGGAIHCTTIGVPYHAWDYLVDAQVSIEPVSPPIIILPAGGSFEFAAGIDNLEPDTIWYDVWIDLTFPNGNQSNPIIKRERLYLPPSGTLGRQLTQTIPGSFPAGYYTYTMYVGSYLPEVISQQSSLAFQKIGQVDGITSESATLSGWDISEATENLKLKTETYDLVSAYPNPFNPTTVLSYELSVSSRINLSVYDISGRKVVKLVDGFRDAGHHEVTFDGSGLASGVYLYRLQTSGFPKGQAGATIGTGTPTTTTGKMVLMK